MLRLHDLRRVYRIIDSCLQVGADPDGWRHRLGNGVRDLVAAPIVINGEFRDMFDATKARALHVVDIGWVSPEQQAGFVRYQLEGGNRTDPLRAAIDARAGPTLVASAVGIMGHDAYFQNAAFKKYMEPIGVGDQLLAITLIPGDVGGRSNMISCIRSLDDKPFGARERRLLRILAAELTPLIGTRLADSRDPVMRLTPRQHQTLRLLLEGGSEDAIAKEIGIARSTLHKVVVGLYRLFDVNSRAALQARFAGRGSLSRERERTSDPRLHRGRREGGVPMTTEWRAPSTIRRRTG